jgi:hypothetical protein
MRGVRLMSVNGKVGKSMLRPFVGLLLLAFGMPLPVKSCDCGPPFPACAYLSADAIFIGRVAFTDDDPSRGWAQKTFVRFDVLEVFKGLTPGDRQVWVDPGSFTSCYKTYRMGEKWLIFGRRRPQLGDSAAMSLMPGGTGRRKPLPPGIDPTKPPTIYFAPECSGARGTDSWRVEEDQAMLRTYRAGRALPRVLGHVYLYPYRGWPWFSGPALKGVRVTLSSDSTTLSVTTDEKGAFALKDAPPGTYSAITDQPPFRTSWYGGLSVPAIGCGYTEVELKTTSTLQGIVLDHRGRPAAEIPVKGWLANGAVRNGIDDFALRDTTDASGQFSIEGVPDEGIILSTGDHLPYGRLPRKLVYYPGSTSPDRATVFRLKPDEHRQNLVIWLDPPLERGSVAARVFDKSGNPATNAFVQIFKDGVGLVAMRTDKQGLARSSCFRGLEYELQAVERADAKVTDVLESSRVRFKCGPVQAEHKLVLDRPAPQQ